MSKSDRKPKALGRPPKFSEPSRVVTLTLPESTLAQLEALDRDRARAVVRAVRVATSSALQHGEPDGVEIVSVGQATGLILVPQAEALSALKGVSLLEISPGRHLVVLEPGTPLAEIELALADSLDRADLLAASRGVLGQLLDKLRRFRRCGGSRTGEVILLELETPDRTDVKLQ